MSATTSRRTSTGPWIGISLGIVVLGLVAAFAIGLPKATGDEGGSGDSGSEKPLALPAKLPGGYVAADDADSFAGGELAAQAEQIATAQAANTDYGNRVLPDVLGVDAVTRSYVADGTQAVFVQAFRSDGGAFAPEEVPDPEQSGGQAATELERVGKGACILTYTQTAQDQAPTVGSSQCQVARDGITVQIAAAGVEAKELVKVADALVDRLGDQ